MQANLAPEIRAAPGGDQPGPLSALRVLLVHPDAEIAARRKARLEALGALVSTISTPDFELRKAQSLDPDVLLLAPAARSGTLGKLVRELQSDWRVRWAITLNDDPPRWGASGENATWAAERIVELTHARSALASRMQQEDRLRVRLEATGGARLLRMAAATGRCLRLTVTHPHAEVEVDVHDGEIAGAEGRSSDRIDERIPGQHAVSMLLSLPAGQVEIRSQARPTLSGLKGSADLILATASPELAWLAPLGLMPLVSSIPPPPRLPSGAGRIVTRVAPPRDHWVGRVALFAMIGIAAGLAALHVWINVLQ